MALLGTLVQKWTISRAGDGLKGITYATVAHSLPHTNPELLLPIARSYEELTWSTNGYPKLLGFGGNASLATVGYAQASCVSCPTVLYDLFAIVFHSVIR